MADADEMSLRTIFLEFIHHPEARWTLLCVVLLAALLGWIPSPMTRQQDQNTIMLSLLQNQIDAINRHDKSSNDARRELTAQTTYSNMLLRSLCRSVVTAQRQQECEPKYQGYEER